MDGKIFYTLSTEYTANVGNYESRKVGGSVGGVFSNHALPEAVGEHLYDRLYEALNDELSLVKDLAKRNKDSMIHYIATN